MNTLVWNVRGVGKPLALEHCRALVRKYEINIVCLIESKCTRDKFDDLKNSIGFDKAEGVPCNGRSGGIVISSNSDVTTSILSMDNNIVFMHISSPKLAMYVMFIYGHPVLHLRHQVWSRVQHLHTTIPQGENFVILGDFNQVLTQEDKLSSTTQSIQGSEALQSLIDSCEWIEVPAKGQHFTGTNNRDGNDLVWERLDRAFVNYASLQNFPNLALLNLPVKHSDHGLMVFSTDYKLPFLARPYRFEAMWITHPQCRQVIQSSWETPTSGSPSYQLVQKLKITRNNLQNWNRDVFGNLYKRRADLELKLQHAQHHMKSLEAAMEEKQIRLELHNLEEQEQVHWMQKSRENWILLGDRNTRFYHLSTVRRRARNRIVCLLDNNNAWVEDQFKLRELIVQNFKALYDRTDPLDIQVVETELDKIALPILNNHHKDILEKDFTTEEICTATHQIAPLKASGIDGKPGIFYQKFWDIVGHLTTDSALAFLNLGFLLAELNKTLIILIPKKQECTRVSDFRPIGLCNIAYKIITKALVNRLKPIMRDVTTPFQNAFVAGRTITDNVVLASEIFATIKAKKQGRGAIGAIKLDMHKAYNRISWEFLSVVLSKMGFGPKWIQIILQCIGTVYYQVLVNGCLSPMFKPHRGLRQGDPLSPYLFILCQNVLSLMLSTVEARGELSGIKISRHSPAVNHLFFADDSLLFFQVTPKACRTVKKIISTFCTISGQSINNSKSEFFISPAGSPQKKRWCTGILGIHEVMKPGKYLCFQIGDMNKRRDFFQPLLDKFYSKLSSWKAKHLSQAGRLVLIKSTLTSLLVYLYSCVKAPQYIHHKVDQISRNFYWGHDPDTRKLHMCKWERLCSPKREGGLGIRSSEVLNLALLGKQAWNYFQDPKTMAQSIVHSKYCCKFPFAQVNTKSNDTWIWKSILQGRDAIVKYIDFQVAQGRQVTVSNSQGRLNIRQASITDLNLNVCISDAFKIWNVGVTIGCFGQEWERELQSRGFSIFDGRDHMVWGPNHDGRFTVRSAYDTIWTSKHHVDANMGRTELWNNLWKLKVPPKLRHFLWKILSKTLSTADELRHREILVEETCCLCKSAPETLDHMFRTCAFALVVWFGLGIALRMDHPSFTHITLWLEQWLMGNLTWLMDDHITTCTINTILWSIWTQRNNAIYKKVSPSPQGALKHSNTFRDQIIQAYIPLNSTINSIQPHLSRRTTTRVISTNPASISHNYVVVVIKGKEGDSMMGGAWLFTSARGTHTLSSNP